MKKNFVYLILFFSLLCSRSFTQTASFQVTYLGANPQVELATEKACEIWSDILVSSEPIKINFYWVNASQFGFLGLTLSNGVKNFQNAPINDVWYPTSLAKAIAGNDLQINDVDIDIFLDSTYNWYYGTDGNCPANQHHLVKVILHEIGHGLGFYSVANLDQSGIGSFSHVIDPMVNSFASFPIPNLNGEPLIYDLFIENLQGQQLVDTNLFINPSIALSTQFTGNNLYFNGLNTVNANNQSRPRLYAPSTFAFGSSILHLNESSFASSSSDGLMTPFSGAGETNLVPGPITLGMLKDMGWSINPSVTSTSYFESITLSNNYPNPFSTTTTFNFFLKRSSPIEFIIYDLYGKKVKIFQRQFMKSGLQQFVWDGTDIQNKKVAPGVYTYQLKSNSKSLSKKLILTSN